MTALEEAKQRLLPKLTPREKAELLSLLEHETARVFPGIEKTPGVCGGSACIAGTRIPVWGLEERAESGEQLAVWRDRGQDKWRRSQGTQTIVASPRTATCAFQIPRFARQSNTAPTAWKMKFGTQRIRYGAHSDRVSSAWPRTMKL